MKPLKKNEKKRIGGTLSFEERKIKQAQENEDREEIFGKFLAHLPDTAFQLIVSKWEKGAGPKYEEKFAIRVIKDVGFFPLCWDLDKDLYPLLRKQNDPKEKKMVEELVNNLKIELAKKYTILPPEEEPKEGETEAEKQARETREKKRYCFSKTRRDPKEGVGSLIDAATDGRELAIQGLLNAGVRVNAADSEGQTPLFFAAFNGHEACVARLLKDPGVQVNAADNNGWTPLHWATKPIIKQMLEEAEKAEKRKKASSSSSGGKPKTKPKVSKDYVTYTGKKYVVRVGSKGGKYILVGAEKKKVYVK